MLMKYINDPAFLELDELFKDILTNSDESFKKIYIYIKDLIINYFNNNNIDQDTIDKMDEILKEFPNDVSFIRYIKIVNFLKTILTI